MMKLKKFLNDSIDLPMWAILLVDFILILNIILSVIVIVKK